MQLREVWQAFCVGCSYEEFARLFTGKAYPPRCPKCGTGVVVQFYVKEKR